MLDQITVRDVRNINKSNIIRTLMSNRDISRNEISIANNISVMTVKNIVDDLLKKNIITERKIDSSLIGRKPTVLNISNSVGKLLTIDLTSKKLFYYVVYNIYMEKIDKRYYKCDVNRSFLDNLSNFLAMVKEDIERLNISSLLGIGVAVPGVYFEEEDRISNELIKELNDIRLKEMILERFGVENIVIDHDVKMATVAESVGMSNSASKEMYYIFIGEGVGGAFIINGEIYSGSNQVAGDLGQFIVCCDSDDEYNLESIASLPAIVSSIRRKMGGDEAAKGYSDLDFNEILKMYKEGEKIVVNHFEYVLKILSRVIFNIVWLVNPGRIIIGSNYREFSQLVSDFSTSYVKGLLNNKMGIDPSIYVSKYDENSALIGLFETVVNRWIEKV